MKLVASLICMDWGKNVSKIWTTVIIFSHSRNLSDSRSQIDALEASLNAARREADALREQIQVQCRLLGSTEL